MSQASDTPDVRALPPLDLYLQLIPQPDGGAEGIPHAVALFASPPEDRRGVIFRIQVHPAATEESAGTRLSYTAEIAPMDLSSEPAPDHPWAHRTDTPEVREAAARVLVADPGERRTALLALLAEIAP